MRPPLLLGFALATCASSCATGPDHQQQSHSSVAISVPVIARPEGETPAWWFRAGAASANAHGAGRSHATNLILFIGDGMSLATVAAARIYEGQLRGQPGEENQLSFERFPYTALSRTYNTDSQTPDSAGTMTAMVTGVKTRIGLLSVGQQAEVNDCAAGLKAPLVTTLELAEVAGLSTGVVTTTRITHATPAATYAHTTGRDWESDADLPQEAKQQGCIDIARQLVEFKLGNGIEVALGGGRSTFHTTSEPDPEYQELHGKRLDGHDLIAEWQQHYPQGHYVWNAGQLTALDLAHTQQLLGLFEPEHMNFEHDRAKDRAGEPSLAEMTRAAITVLKQNPKGYFLMVEGGRIDHAHHLGNAYRALTDTVAFSDAIRTATELTSDADTLIVVTADHSHTLSFVGYPRRGNPILGKVMESSDGHKTPTLAKDALGLPYTTLSYANGPGYTGSAQSRPDLSNLDTEAADYLQEATLPTVSETHGGDDVGVWARGPGSDAVHGSIEQNEIFHLMIQAQPDIVQLLCRMGDCENGVPVNLPALTALSAGQ